MSITRLMASRSVSKEPNRDFGLDSVAAICREEVGVLRDAPVSENSPDTKPDGGLRELDNPAAPAIILRFGSSH